MLLLNQGEVVCETSASMEFSGKDTFSLTLEISNPHLWMGTENPYLYQVKLELYEEETVVEERSISTGFRTIQITSEQGLFLNGKHVKLRGVARHQDFGGVGNAVSKENMECDMQLIKEIGANSVRLSHYQHDDYFYQRCDEEGILVWAEVPFISIISENEAAEDNIREQMRRLILQCGNHTSVYCWGVQNEITIAGENEEIHAHVKRMSEYTKNLDPDRYTAEANIYSVANESPINRLAELVGYNLYYGWYYDTISGLQKRLDEFHAACPGIPLLVTEYGVDTNPQYHSYEPKPRIIQRNISCFLQTMRFVLLKNVHILWEAMFGTFVTLEVPIGMKVANRDRIRKDWLLLTAKSRRMHFICIRHTGQRPPS